MPRLRLTLPLRVLLAVASGVLLFAANPPLEWWPLAFVALIPLLWGLRGVGPLRAALIGWVFGFTYFGLLMYWLALFGTLAWMGSALLQAAFLALFGLLVPAVVRQGRPVLSAGGVAATWVAVEFLRSSFPLGGLGWGAPSYTQGGNEALLHLASITGAWGVTFVVVLVNALLASLHGGWGRRAGVLAVCAGLVLGPAAIPISLPDGPSVNVAALQVPVPKGAALQRAEEIRAIADLHVGLHRTLKERPPDLIVWAEDSLDVDPALDPVVGAQVREAIASVGAPTLAGVIAGPAGGRLFNQSVLYDGTGAVVDRHTKVHLVAFGEYVPWRSRLGFLDVLDQVRTDLTPGRVVRPLTLGDVSFGSLICFENLFPEVARSEVAQGAGFLVVPSNNTSYLTTAASRQHLNITRLRAAENARWALHSSLAGVSAVVDPLGRLSDRTELFREAVVRAELPTSSSRTIYNRFGEWFAWASVLWSGILILLPGGRLRPQRDVGLLPEDPRTLVILPTYNERATIEEVVSRLLALPYGLDLLVIDDGSPDGTADAVEAMGESRVRVLRRPRKSGLASAYLTGFEIACDEGYDLAVEMDSDLSHDPDELPGLLEAAASNHLTIGSRYVPGGSVTNWGFVRRLLSKAGNRYARLCLGFPLTDSTSGFRVYRRPLLEEEVLHRGIHSEGYGFQIELAFRSWRDGWTVGEAPITFKEREHGHSKISRTIVLEALWEVTLWGVRARFGRSTPDPAQRP